MDRKEAIRLFIKQNSSIFKRKPFPWEAFKKLKRCFFTDQVRSVVPKDSEIAGDIVEGMILSLQIKNKEDLDNILALPFFNKRIHNKKYYYERLELKAKQVTPLLDVKSLEKADFADKIRKELKAEVRDEFFDEKKRKLKSGSKELAERLKNTIRFRQS